MSAPINTGGPVFPTLKKSGSLVLSEGGMTLRDWFAGQALNEFASWVSIKEPHTFEVVAKYCYQMADAMLAEREKSGAA